LVNGFTTYEFPLKRGLRQGEPLSPILFLHAAKGLNIMRNSSVDSRSFHIYHVGRGDSVQSYHLQFEDDTLIIVEKTRANVKSLQAVLLLFAAVSGLNANFNKSMLT